MGFSFRWGVSFLDATVKGGVQVPGFIMRNYAKVGIKPADMMLVLHLAAYHYETPNGKSSPSLNTVANDMGYGNSAQVRKIVKRLEDDGFLVVERRPGDTNIYDASPIARACLELEDAQVNSDEFDTDNMPANTPDPVPFEVPTKSGVPLKRITEDKEAIAIYGSINRTTSDASESKGEDRKNIPSSLDEFRELQGIVITNWFDGNWRMANWAGGIARMMLGQSDDARFKDFNLDEPVTASELRAFCDDYRRRGISWPTKPAAINQNIYAFRQKAKGNSSRMSLGERPNNEIISAPPMPKSSYNPDGTPID